jgi:hypothetical protein
MTAFDWLAIIIGPIGGILVSVLHYYYKSLLTNFVIIMLIGEGWGNNF